MVHGEPVADAHDAELHGHAAARAHAGLDRVDDAAEMQVPGDDLAERIGDADERALHLGVAHSERAQQRTVRRSRQTLLDLVASHGSLLLVAGGRPRPLRAAAMNLE